MSKRYIRLATLLAAFMLSTIASAETWVTKNVTSQWTWCEDYIYYAYTTYVVVCEPSRECQVGMGVFTFGMPLGEKIRFSGQREINVIGLGAIHMRVTDGKGAAKVAFMRKSAKLIETSPIPW